MKKIYFMLWVAVLATFVSCDSKTSKDVIGNVMGKDTVAEAAKTDEASQCESAFDELIKSYKMKVNACTTCSAIDQCQMEFTRDYDALIAGDSDIAKELHVKAQQGITELGSLMNKKKTELGCGK